MGRIRAEKYRRSGFMIFYTNVNYIFVVNKLTH